MKTLQLTIKKQWFNLILSGKKTEEYREIKEYWITRLTLYPFRGGYEMKKFDAVQFINGYGKDKPTATFECKGIEIGIGDKTLGALEEDIFIIKLGKELNRNNI